MPHPGQYALGASAASPPAGYKPPHESSASRRVAPDSGCHDGNVGGVLPTRDATLARIAGSSAYSVSPGHCVYHVSRWPTMVGIVTVVPAANLSLPTVRYEMGA